MGANIPAKEFADSVVVRFAGDSGDGVQLTGSQFTTTAALAGNDFATLPDYPAEIRAPIGTTPGVSGFQIHLSSSNIFTPGDDPDVLVALNAAALKVNLPTMKKGCTLIVNTDGFDRSNLVKSGYASTPLEDGHLDDYRTYKIPITTLTLKVLKDSVLNKRAQSRCKNFFALGVVYWLYSHPIDSTENWIRTKFSSQPEILEANLTALRGGYAYADAGELFQTRYEIPAAPQAPGLYRNIDGNKALSLGLYAAAERAGIPLFLGSYPITPASDILAELANLKPYGVMTFQAEDEIAAVCSAIGASFGGCIGVTTTSGPGVALKSEAIGLAVMTELPLVIVNVQRGGPSTGLPTKTEQSDLLQAFFGRNGECPAVIVAASSSSDCFATAIEAVRLAVEHMTPVILLSDGYIANGSEPWKVPSANELPAIQARFRDEPADFQPFARDPETLVREWARPGTPGMEHRIGGLEHTDGAGNISYDPMVHEQMTHIRAEKVARIARAIPLAEVFGENTGDVLVVGWGGTYGAIHAAVREAQKNGWKVSQLHLRHLNPFPANLGDLLRRFRKVIVAELNLGQLDVLLRNRFLLKTVRLNKVQGQPFKVSEVVASIKDNLPGGTQ
jgi:2-oxoglutarate/2-oxoacid ferredoxin oxidoreductase subunit alpha